MSALPLKKQPRIKLMYRLLPAIISCLLLAAHFLRAGNPGLVALWLSFPLLLAFKRNWATIIFQLVIFSGSAIWIAVLADYWQARALIGAPKLRLALILGGVACFTAVSALVFFTPALKKVFSPDDSPVFPAITAFLLTFVTFSIIRFKVSFPIILLERFIRGGGWLEAFWLAVYAGFLAVFFQSPANQKKWRPRIWGLFSFIFFLQLAIGLAGQEQFLMTGRLHLPVPALILAGPLYRGSGFFMLILFSVTVLLVGPAWCSWLCYIGPWDDCASRLKSRPGSLPSWRGHLRIVLLVVVLLTAFTTRVLNVPTIATISSAAVFGVIGVGFMVGWSRRVGLMTHCVSYCPVGFVSTRLGKLSPFRIKIDDDCDKCGACRQVCRYDSLGKQDIERRQPGEACTLCGDCVSQCGGGHIGYHFSGLTPHSSRVLFIILITSLHAVFVGVARI